MKYSTLSLVFLFTVNAFATAEGLNLQQAQAGPESLAPLENLVWVDANPMLKKCIDGPDFSVKPENYTNADFDCIQNTANTNYKTWSGVLYNSATNTPINGFYDTNGVRCANCKESSLQYPIAIKVMYKIFCPPDGSSHTKVTGNLVKCTVADKIAVYSATYMDKKVPGMAEIKPVIVGPTTLAGAVEAVPVSMNAINAIKYKDFSCSTVNPKYIQLGVDADGTPKCGPDPNQQTIDSMANMMCVQERQRVVMAGGETNDQICNADLALKMPKLVGAAHDVKQCKDLNGTVVRLDGKTVEFTYGSEPDGIKFKDFGASSFVALKKADVIANHDGKYFCRLSYGSCGTVAGWSAHEKWSSAPSVSCRAPDSANQYEAGCGSSANSAIAEQYRVNTPAYTWLNQDPVGVDYIHIQTGCSEKRLNGDCKTPCAMWANLGKYDTCISGRSEVGCK